MIDPRTGAPRPVNENTRRQPLSAAQELVERTLARHGLSSTPNQTPAQMPQGLADMMQGFLARDGAPPQTGVTPRPAIPEGAQFTSAVHQGRSGQRAYRTYIPASAGEGVTGVVLMLHGCTQSPEDFAIGTGMNALAEEHRFVVLYPEQTRGSNAQTCWNWFSPNDQRRDRGEPEILAGIARLTMAQYDVPAQSTFVAGLSAGGAMAVILGQTYPDVFTAVGVHSGLPYGAAQDVASAFAAMAGQAQNGAPAEPQSGVRTIVFHGSADTTVHPSNGALIADHAQRHGPSQSFQTTRAGTVSGRRHATTISTGPDGCDHLEHWVIDGLGHAWSGGKPGGSYTDARGPDASAEMIRFFFAARE